MLVEGVEDHSDHEKQAELQKDHDSTRQQSALALAAAARGKQLLHNQLIRAVAGSVQKHAADKPRPEQIGLAPVEMEIENGELVAC